MLHASADGGVAVSILGPVSARLNDGVSINVTTEYPFDDNVTVTLTGLPAGTLTFPLYIRIPSWATNATLAVNGGTPVSVGAANGTMLRVAWAGAAGPTATVVLATNPTVRVSAWYNGALAVFRGALLYSLRLDETFEVTGRNAADARAVDYIVSQPGCDLSPAAPNCTAPFNVALVIDDFSAPAAGFSFSRTGPTPPVPFAAGLWGASNLELTATVRTVAAWGLASNAAAPPPASPVDCSAALACGAPYIATFVPYGATHLRMAELPFTGAVQCPSVGANASARFSGGGAADFVFAGGADAEPNGADDNIRSGNPGDESTAAYVVVARDAEHIVTGFNFSFRYVAGYGPDGAPGGATLDVVALAPGKCGSTGGAVLAVLYSSPVLDHYPFDSCATCYSPPIVVDIRGLSLNATAGIVFALRFHNNARNVQLKLPLPATLSWK